MLEHLEAGLRAWLMPGLSALMAVVVTYVTYRLALAPVSYTHLTLPTKRIV